MDLSYSNDDRGPETVFKEKLHDVFIAYQCQIKDFKAEIIKLQKQQQQLETAKSQLQDDVDATKEENTKLISKNDSLRKQLQKAEDHLQNNVNYIKDENARLVAKNESLNQELQKIKKQQPMDLQALRTKIFGEVYAQWVSFLKHRVNTGRDNPSANETIEAFTQAQGFESQYVFEAIDSQLADSPEKAKRDSSACKEISNSLQRSSTSGLVLRHRNQNYPSPKKKVTKSLSNIEEGNSKSQSQPRNETSDSHGKGGKKENTLSPKEMISQLSIHVPKEKDVSPKPRRNLRLNPDVKKRHRVTEEDQPSSKRFKMQGTSILCPVKKSSDQQQPDKLGLRLNKMQADDKSKNAAPLVLVVDTCTDSSQNRASPSLHDDTGNNETSPRAIDPCNLLPNVKKASEARPDVIIPETMPLNYTEDDEEEEADSQSQAFAMQDIDLSPPSHASTPVCSNNRNPQLGESPRYGKKHDVGDMLNDGSDTEKNAGAAGGKSLPQRRSLHHYPSTDSMDDDVSEAGSPVFKKNQPLRNNSRQTTIHSPSLFDEDDIDPDSSASSTLPIETVSTTAAKYSQIKALPLNKTRLISRLQNGSNHMDLCTSVPSDVSPSMLSGKIHKLTGRDTDEWLSTSMSKVSPNNSINAQAKAQADGTAVSSTKSSMQEKKSSFETSVMTAGSSPVRMTRSKKILSEKANTSLTTSKSAKLKSLKQTTISKKFFHPQKTQLVHLENFNGGRLSGSQRKQQSQDEAGMNAQERADLDEALERSLVDMGTKQGKEFYFSEIDVDMSEPQFTSTPAVVSYKAQARRISSTSSTSSDTPIFKKPATPTTPKRIHGREGESELRRSPRLTMRVEFSQDDTIDPNQELPEGSINPSLHRHPKNTNVHRTLNLAKHGVATESLYPNSEMMHANGSLDPDVRLSELDPEESRLDTSPQFQEPISFLDIYEAESENKAHSVRTQQTAGGTNEEVEVSSASAVFESNRKNKQQRQQIDLDDSFDRVPRKKEADYKYNQVVRKKTDREKLERYACHDCEKYYGGQGLTDDEIKERMKSCKHRACFVPAGSPENLWEVELPDTQECQERGYMNITQAKPGLRRKHPLNALWNEEERKEPMVRRQPSTRTTRARADMGDVTRLFEGEDTQDE